MPKWFQGLCCRRKQKKNSNFGLCVILGVNLVVVLLARNAFFAFLWSFRICFGPQWGCREQEQDSKQRNADFYWHFYESLFEYKMRKILVAFVSNEKTLSTLFENHSKCRIWILYFWHFPPIFDLFGNTVWPQVSAFQKLAKLAIFGIFN